MSYDLFFWTESESPGVEEFDRHFSSRRWYRVNQGQAQYGNENTGVYFSFQFEHETEAPEENGDDGRKRSRASFNINYVRSGFFGREALPEVRAFVDAFHLNIFDPQSNGMGDGPFSDEGFLRGWNAGNEFAVGAMLQMHGTEAVSATLPALILESGWRWNFNRDKLGEKAGDVFVPQIMYGRVNGSIKTFCAWPDAIPVLLPRCDGIIIGRDELANKGFLKRFLGGGGPQVIFIDYEQVLPLLERYERNSEPLEWRALNYTRPPDNLVEFIRSLPLGRSLPEGIAPGSIIEEEVVKRCREQIPRRPIQSSEPPAG